MSKIKTEVDYCGGVYIICPECQYKQEVKLNWINFSCDKCGFVVANFDYDDFELNILRDYLRNLTRNRARIRKSLELFSSKERLEDKE